MNPSTVEERSVVTVGATQIGYTVMRSKRRRRTIEIRVDAARGVLVAVPWRMSKRDVAAFVMKRARWILNRSQAVADRPAVNEIAAGALLPYLGGDVVLIVQPSSGKTASAALRPAELVDGPLSADRALVVAAAPAALPKPDWPAHLDSLVKRWYRARALEAVRESVAFWSPAVGRTPSDVRVRDQKRLWGSCAADGTIRFNWRLVQLDPSLIDYVVVHELSHLIVRNHSPLFWNEVGRVMPDYLARRKRLRQAGALVLL